MLIQWKLQNTLISSYNEALNEGAVPAAYVRLMFLGPGGSGKSSLLDGLMNIPLQQAESTALADTRTVSYKWIAADSTEEAWKPRTDDDEKRNLAAKAHQLQERELFDVSKDSSIMAERTFCLPRNTVSSLQSDEHKADPNAVNKLLEFKKEHYEELIKHIKREKLFSQFRNRVKATTEVVMHIWDCGGQPVFLDIVSAFLTSRTMFLLLFDGSVDLSSMYQEKWHHKGIAIPGREQNITQLQLMKQWLQLIHSSLVKESEEASSNQATASPNVLPNCPRAMLIGTRRDKITSEKAKAVVDELNTACDGAAFGDIVVDKLIVDNTKAGKGKDGEDPKYKHIRNNIHKFAESLIIPTPLAWLAFRQVLQKADLKHPILSYSEVCIVAKECGIREEVVPSVLHFYHQLGSLLHYANIPSLANTIIVEPQWLINQLRKLLMPEWYLQRPEHLKRLWKRLEEMGILTEEMYQEIWRDCGLMGGGQALMDLLEHFDLAKQIYVYPREMGFYKGIKYFVPCMVKVRPKGVKIQEATPRPIRQAATLYVSFNTGYTPPGFFIRLIARITNHKGYTPLLNRQVYRDSITFECNELDRLIISESLQTLNLNYFRVVQRKENYIRFTDSCCSLFNELIQLCKAVCNDWMPSVEVLFKFECPLSDNVSRHFILLDTNSHQESVLCCEHYHKCTLSRYHKYWLPPPPILSDVSDLFAFIPTQYNKCMLVILEQKVLLNNRTENGL